MPFVGNKNQKIIKLEEHHCVEGRHELIYNTHLQNQLSFGKHPYKKQ